MKRRRALPQDGELVVARVESSSHTTRGWVKNETRTVFAIYCKRPYPCESASFWGSFLIDDRDANWSKAKVVEWASFSGTGKI